MVAGDKENTTYYQAGNEDAFYLNTGSVSSWLTTQKEAAAQIELATQEASEADQRWQLEQQALYEIAG